MVEDLPVITPAACADYYGSLIYSGIMCIDAAGGKGVCNVSPTSDLGLGVAKFSRDLRVAKFSRDLWVAKFSRNLQVAKFGQYLKIKMSG